MKVYWIHLPEQTDILREGYVGVTTRSLDVRRGEHGDRFPNECVIEEIIDTDEDTALSVERGLRPDFNIGWNIAPGGQAGNRPKGIRTSGWKWSEASKKKRSLDLMGNTNGRFKAVETEFDGIMFRSMSEARDYRLKTYGDNRKNNGGQNARTIVVDGKTFAMKKDAIDYLRKTYNLSKNKSIEHIDAGTPISELQIKRRARRLS